MTHASHSRLDLAPVGKEKGSGFNTALLLREPWHGTGRSHIPFVAFSSPTLHNSPVVVKSIQPRFCYVNLFQFADSECVFGAP